MENFYFADKDNPLVIILAGIVKSGKSEGGKYLNSRLGLGHSKIIEGRQLIYNKIISDSVKNKYQHIPENIPREEYTKTMKSFYYDAEILHNLGPYADLVINEYLKPPPAQITIFSSTRNRSDLQKFQLYLDNCMFIGFDADYETLIKRMVECEDKLDKGDTVEKRLENAEKNLTLEVEVFKPHEAIEYIKNSPVGYVVDTSGQTDTEKMKKELDEIIEMIIVLNDFGKDTRSKHSSRFFNRH